MAGDLSLESEEVEWPKEYIPLELKRGINPIGDCWKLKSVRDSLIESLKEELKKAKRNLSHLERRMNNVQDELNFNIADDNELMAYDIEGEIAQLDILINKNREKVENVETELKGLKERDYYMDDDEDKNEKNDTYCYGKLLLNPYIIRNNRCINDKHHSDNIDEQVEILLKEVTSLKRLLEDYWVDSDVYFTDPMGAIGMMTVSKVLRKSKYYNTDTLSVLYTSPEMVNGSMMQYLENLPNRYDRYQLDDTLLFDNLKEQIKILSFLSKNNKSHNNIKLNNVLISQDTLKLLLSDFCPETLFIERCFKAKNERLTVPYFTSPELMMLLTDERPFNTKESEQFINKIRIYDFPDQVKEVVYSNDIFCLGLVYYHLITLKLPEGKPDYEKITHELENLKSKRNKRLLDVVLSMLEYDPVKRITYSGILEFIM